MVAFDYLWSPPPNFPPSARFVISQSWLIKHRPNRFIWVGWFWRESGLANHSQAARSVAATTVFQFLLKAEHEAVRGLCTVLQSAAVYISALPRARPCDDSALRSVSDLVQSDDLCLWRIREIPHSLSVWGLPHIEYELWSEGSISQSVKTKTGRKKKLV